MKRWLASLVVVAVAALLVPMALVQAQAPAVVYYPQTGHHVGAPFLKYWRENGGLAAYGYPLTEAFKEVSATDGKTYTVQYFERARFEAHPENQAPWDVVLGQLGRTMAGRITGNAAFNPVPAEQARANPGQTYFPESGHTLKGAFREYWNANGDLARFGYPISEEFVERNPTDGQTYTVQYFERNRFEYHPENQPPSRVLLGLLGRQVAEERGLNMAAVPRQADAPDFDESLFFTPTPAPTSTPVPPTATPVPPTPTPAPPPPAPEPPPAAGDPRPELGRTYIEVDLTEQHLYAWENGRVVFDVAISSGTRGWETPTGTFRVLRKLASDDMTGGTAGSDDYYFTPDVPWVMYFDNLGDAIHGVYWHNSFGTPRSHGCVGAPVWAAKWLYDWGYVGLPIWIHY